MWFLRSSLQQTAIYPLGFAAVSANKSIFPFCFVCMSVVISGCLRQQILNRKNKSSKRCFCLEFCWQFCEYFLKHQQNNIFRLFLCCFKNTLDAMGGTWRSIIKPMLPCLVFVVQTQLQLWSPRFKATFVPLLPWGDLWRRGSWSIPNALFPTFSQTFSA